MSTPTIAPPERDPADVAPAGTYHKADPVWVYRDGWHAGVIEAASDRAVTVTYRPGTHHGTGVDTFMPSYVTPRADEDPLDRPMPQRPVLPQRPVPATEQRTARAEHASFSGFVDQRHCA
jgi:hypothetical protein